jgi:hypothetical protein
MICSFSHLLLVQHQVFNHLVMKVINQVLVVLVMVLHHLQLVVMMLVVVFLQSEVPVSI